MVTRTDAETLVLLCESWLRLLSRDGAPPLAAPVVSVLGRLADAAPAVAARCPVLLALLGPSVAYRLKVQAAALPVSDVVQAAADNARWLSTAQAAAVLGISRHGVRDLLRRHQLDGRRRDGGPWEVSAASVRQRRLERAA
jgi:hypothetical protein